MGRKSSRVTRDKVWWKPILSGENYCSLACGGGCKKSEYDKAVQEAATLVHKLSVGSQRGSGHVDGWKPVIWENLGWNFKAVFGLLEVHGDHLGPRGRVKYSCSISGSPICSFFPTLSSDPCKAVAETLERTHAKAVEILEIVYKASQQFGEFHAIIQNVCAACGERNKFNAGGPTLRKYKAEYVKACVKCYDLSSRQWSSMVAARRRKPYLPFIH